MQHPVYKKAIFKTGEMIISELGLQAFGDSQHSRSTIGLDSIKETTRTEEIVRYDFFVVVLFENWYRKWQKIWNTLVLLFCLGSIAGSFIQIIGKIISETTAWECYPKPRPVENLYHTAKMYVKVKSKNLGATKFMPVL